MNTIQNIQQLADGREQITTRKEYTEEEISFFNQEFVENSLNIEKINEDIKELNGPKNDLKNINKNLLNKIRMGFEENTLDAFYIDDLTHRKYYDSEGNLVKERNLRPNEKKQLRMAINQ